MRQAELAGRCGLSVPTIRQVERGRGRLCSFWRVLDELGVELAGRNLPGGGGVGSSLALLRRRRGLSQREVAGLVGVARVTIAALERSGRGRLAALEKVLQVLGAGAYLAGQGERRGFFGHAGTSSVHHGWGTPPEVLRGLYEVFGGFDLDPCSSSASRRGAAVRAQVHFSAAEDGLSLPWHGVVFVNPPYGREVGKWVAKARGEVEAGCAEVVVALLAARTDTRWWHEEVAGAADVFLLRGRLKFGGGKESAPFPSALVVWGADEGAVERLKQSFAAAWYVPRVGRVNKGSDP